MVDRSVCLLFLCVALLLMLPTTADAQVNALPTHEAPSVDAIQGISEFAEASEADLEDLEAPAAATTYFPPYAGGDCARAKWGSGNHSASLDCWTNVAIGHIYASASALGRGTGNAEARAFTWVMVRTTPYVAPASGTLYARYTYFLRGEGKKDPTWCAFLNGCAVGTAELASTAWIESAAGFPLGSPSRVNARWSREWWNTGTPGGSWGPVAVRKTLLVSKRVTNGEQLLFFFGVEADMDSGSDNPGVGSQASGWLYPVLENVQVWVQ